MKKNFTSITMYEIYMNAWNNILANWQREYEKNEKHYIKHGKKSKIVSHRIEKYSKQMDELSEAMNELEREMKTGEQEVTYADIVNILTEQKYIETQFELVSYCIGYYGCFTKEMWEHAQKAFSDGFFKA